MNTNITERFTRFLQQVEKTGELAQLKQRAESLHDNRHKELAANLVSKGKKHAFTL